jgi:hypothetical protein
MKAEKCLHPASLVLGVPGAEPWLHVHDPNSSELGTRSPTLDAGTEDWRSDGSCPRPLSRA